MNLKNIWWILIGTFLLFVPFKIVSSFNTLAFVETGWFLFAFLLVIVGIMVFMKFVKIDMKNIQITKNKPLAVISVLIAASFFWCIPTYFADTSQYDFEWQPVMMALFSILACVTFVIMSAVFISGKNVFSKVPFFIFCPVMWFAMNMILFLSIQNDNTDIYDITLTATLSLFLVYYTQVFATSSKMNMVRLLFAFGIPSVLLAMVKCVPVLVRFINSAESVSPVSASTCSMELLLAVYILVTLVDAYKQYDKFEEPVVRSQSV